VSPSGNWLISRAVPDTRRSIAVFARAGAPAAMARRIARCFGNERRALPGRRLVVRKLTASAE
jgi:hypothetical protein